MGFNETHFKVFDKWYEYLENMIECLIENCEVI